MHRGLQIPKITRKVNHLIYMDNIKLFTKNKKRNPDTNNKNIQPGYGREFDIEPFVP